MYFGIPSPLRTAFVVRSPRNHVCDHCVGALPGTRTPAHGQCKPCARFSCPGSAAAALWCALNGSPFEKVCQRLRTPRAQLLPPPAAMSTPPGAAGCERRRVISRCLYLHLQLIMPSEPRRRGLCGAAGGQTCAISRRGAEEGIVHAQLLQQRRRGLMLWKAYALGH